MTSWLTLPEYSIKKGISISTLRRKIKNSELEYSFKNGRYLIKTKLESQEEENPSKKRADSFFSKELKNLKADKEDLLSLVSLLESEKKELEKHFITLNNNHKDLLSLVSFLESEKKELINIIEQQKPAEL